VPSIEELAAIDWPHAVLPSHAAPVVSFLASNGMTWEEIQAPLRYTPHDRIRARLNLCAENNVLTFDDRFISYTPEGRAAAEACLDARAVALAEKWSNSPDAVNSLLDLLTGPVELACAANMPSLSVHDRAIETPNPTPGSDLWLMLANIRRFRADCHAESWTSAGYTAESIVALTHNDPKRRPIEAHTDELNGRIWASYNSNDQLYCLSALASLDGSGTPT